MMPRIPFQGLASDIGIGTEHLSGHGLLDDDDEDQDRQSKPRRHQMRSQNLFYRLISDNPGSRN